MSSPAIFYILSLVFAFATPVSAGPGLLSSSNPALVGQPVEFTATVAAPAGVTVIPTGTVTFTDNGQELGTAGLQNGAAELTTAFTVAGSHQIVADYSGDANFQPEQSQPFTETITDGDLFTISASPSIVSQKAGGNSAVGLTLFTHSSSAKPVQLSCEQVPAGVTCTFPSEAPVPSSSGTAAALTITSTAQEVSNATASMPYALAALLLPLAFLRCRRRWVSLGAVLLLAAVGCGGGTKTLRAGTPPGSYVIQVTGNDGTTVQTANIQLNIAE